MRRIVVLAAAMMAQTVLAAERPSLPQFIDAMKAGGVTVRVAGRCATRADGCASTFKRAGEPAVQAAISLDKSGRVDGWVAMESDTNQVAAIRFLMAYMVGTGQPKEDARKVMMFALNGDGVAPACCSITFKGVGDSIQHIVDIKGRK